MANWKFIKMPNQQVQDFKKRLYVFTLSLINVLEGVKYDFISKNISNQLMRSGTSIIANFVEGQSGSSKKDFLNFLSISLKSANESKMWLSLLKDTKRISSDDYEILIKELNEISNIIAKSIITTKQNLKTKSV